MPSAWLDQLIQAVTELAPAGTYFAYDFNVRGLLGIILVSMVCGAVGSLVVGNRMSFFSDALAHVAFAGAALGWLLAFSFGLGLSEAAFDQWLLGIMIVVGIVVGIGIAYVRDSTSLANDTVIGVFFAGAMGFGVMLLKNISKSSRFSPEMFIFGDLVNVTSGDIFHLLSLTFATALFLTVLYNRLLFASFNTSLAQSRQLRVRLCNYLFIVLLALIVNLCFRMVGVLLITALLIVPAATAANLCRNLRQMFWGTVLLSVLATVLGLFLSWEANTYMLRREEARQGVMAGRSIEFVQGGTIVVLSVLGFFGSMAVAARRQAR